MPVLCKTIQHIPSPLCIDELQGAPLKLDHRYGQAVQMLQTLHEENSPLLQLPQFTGDLDRIETYAAQIRRQSDKLVLVGIGGSSLGAKALTSIADSADPLAFHILDNPDPASVDALLSSSDPARTSWLFVSKSGGTLETLSQIMIILQWLEERIGQQGIAERCFVITESKDSPLCKLAQHYRMPVLKHVDLGGRWACLSNIGLLPAACRNIDIRAYRLGADTMVQHALISDIAENQPLQGALFVAAQYHASRRVHVLMPYADRLDITPWYSQLISESLGKEGKGITPLAARGAVDQHSMLQLMLDGPDDKIFTLVTSEHAGKGKPVPAVVAELCGLDYLAGQPIGNVLDAFQEGTIGSLKASGRPVRVIHLPEIDAFHLGALLMYFMLETLYVAALLDVDPFNQPAVEDSKRRAKLILRNQD